VRFELPRYRRHGEGSRWSPLAAFTPWASIEKPSCYWSSQVQAAELSTAKLGSESRETTRSPSKVTGTSKQAVLVRLRVRPFAWLACLGVAFPTQPRMDGPWSSLRLTGRFRKSFCSSRSRPCMTHFVGSPIGFTKLEPSRSSGHAAFLTQVVASFWPLQARFPFSGAMAGANPRDPQADADGPAGQHQGQQALARLRSPIAPAVPPM
jgi:hypothetical protein